MKIIEIPKEHIFTAVSVNGVIVDNLKPIKVDDYWLVFDTKAEIKENDFCTSDKNIIDIGKIHNQYIIFNPKTKDGLEKLKSCWKIIASTRLIDKSIPVIKFVEESVEENAAKYSDKKFTELDIIIIRNKLVDILPTGNVDAWDLIQAILEYTKWFDEFTKSLNRPKLPDVINLEMEEIPICCKLYINCNSNCTISELDYKLKTKSTLEGEVIEIKI
jgi:hypothetical protein